MPAEISAKAKVTFKSELIDLKIGSPLKSKVEKPGNNPTKFAVAINRKKLITQGKIACALA